MYVILVYDIKTDNGGQKVLNRTFKICKKYLCHIQNSVFEGELSEAQIVKDGYKIVKSMLIYIRVEVAPYWNVNRLLVYLFLVCLFVEVAPYWNVNGT